MRALPSVVVVAVVLSFVFGREVGRRDGADQAAQRADADAALMLELAAHALKLNEQVELLRVRTARLETDRAELAKVCEALTSTPANEM